jgi:hypothetical protein
MDMLYSPFVLSFYVWCPKDVRGTKKESSVYASVCMGRYGHIDAPAMKTDKFCTGIGFRKNNRASVELVMVPVLPSPYLIPSVMTNVFANAAPPLFPEISRQCSPSRAMLHFLLRLNITANSKQLSAQNLWTISELLYGCLHTVILTG